jgi:hypothetical protein
MKSVPSLKSVEVEKVCLKKLIVLISDDKIEKASLPFSFDMRHNIKIFEILNSSKPNMITKAPIASIAKQARARIICSSRTSKTCSFSSLHVVRNFLSLADTSDEPQNPLSDLKEMAQAKNLCDEHGFRVADKHWAFVLSATDVSSADTKVCSFITIFHTVCLKYKSYLTRYFDSHASGLNASIKIAPKDQNHQLSKGIRRRH